MGGTPGAIHAAALHLPPIQWLLRIETLPLQTWLVAALVSLSVLVASRPTRPWMARRDAAR